MQKCLDHNNILMYLTDNEGKSTYAETWMKALKGIIYKTMAANDSRSYLGYLNKLVDEYNYAYHRSPGKTPVDTECSTLTEEIKLS